MKLPILTSKLWTLICILSLSIFIQSCECEDLMNLECEVPLATPVIELDSTATVEINGQVYTRYFIPVLNYYYFPDHLFAASPDLPACGQNTSASRTWVDIYDENNNRLYGFCAFDEASDLKGIWFSVKQGDPIPQQVCIKLTDRKCERSVFSNKISISCPSDLPTPILTFAGTEEYTTSTGTFVRYRIPVKNWEDFADALFAASPDLPACGLNTNASRSWVDIYNHNNVRLYGFCALGDNSDLKNIWFAIPKGSNPPAAVYIKITDRRCDQVVKSNLVRFQ